MELSYPDYLKITEKLAHNPIIVNQNLIFYLNRDTGKVHLKVTDYQKGYWAETPLSHHDFCKLLEILSNLILEAKKNE